MANHASSSDLPPQRSDITKLVQACTELCQLDDKTASFFTCASDNMEAGNPLLLDTSSVQRRLHSIPCLQTLINRFSHIDTEVEPEPLDWAICAVIEEAPVIQVAAVLFAGGDIFTAFTINQENAIVMLLHYKVAEAHVSDVYFYMDYFLYADPKKSVVRPNSNRSIKTHVVKLEGMCFIDEQAFLNTAERIYPRNVSLE